MKSASVASALAALTLVLAAGHAPAGLAQGLPQDDLPQQPLQPPVQSDEVTAPDDSQRSTPRRVVPPPKPPGNTQIQPGLTFLHKEGSSTTIERAREQSPVAEPTLPDGSPIILPDETQGAPEPVENADTASPVETVETVESAAAARARR